MSRCIPFPPPGYVWNGVQGDALIELIKVRREKAEIEKRGKKEEKKKEKRERKLEGEFKKNKHSYHGGHRQHWSGDGNEGSGYQARNEHEFQGIERTGLAEELKQPSISDSLSFDRSLSGKRRRPERCHNHDRPGVELSCPQTELVRDRKAGSALISRYSGSGLQHIELNFGESVVNRIPLPMKREHPEFENLEWLYETKPRRQPPSGYTEIYSVSTDKSYHPVSSLYPTVHQYLAQADTHALPFTIPF